MRPARRVIETRQPVRNQVIGWPGATSQEVVWTLVDAVPELTPEGEVAGVIASLTNITDLRRAEEEKRISQEMFTKAFHSSPDTMTITTLADGRYLEVNDAFSRQFGWTREEAIGRNVRDLGVWPDPSERSKLRDLLLRQRRVTQFETRMRVKSGKFLTVLISADVIVLNGQTCMLAVARDITEQVRREEALRQLSAHLLQLQDEERRRLGRDLHDSLAQSVLAVNLSLAKAARSSASHDERTRRALAEARALLQEMSRQIRTLSYLLHPPLLDELGLASALAEYAQGFSERSGITVEVDVPAEFGRLPQELEIALFRTVQESLSNIQRHSGSRTAAIRLHAESSGVILEVSDQGRGVTEASGRNHGASGARLGVGILGMRERMVQLGGKLEIQSSTSGTTVRAMVPLKSEVSRAASHSGG
jgi:PAS domain S-box-containing protein